VTENKDVFIGSVAKKHPKTIYLLEMWKDFERKNFPLNFFNLVYKIKFVIVF